MRAQSSAEHPFVDIEDLLLTNAQTQRLPMVLRMVLAWGISKERVYLCMTSWRFQHDHLEQTSRACSTLGRSAS